jgi:type IV secretory pathway VirB4 component
MPVDPLKIAIKGSTQDHLTVEDIVDEVVILKDGSCAMVLQLSSVNFDLLSEREQMALVYAYGGILNSLNFPIQIVIHSTTKDVTAYLKNLKEAEEKQLNPLLKERISSYRRFIEETVKKNDVLSKSFYIAIPFSLLELGIKSAPSQAMTVFFPTLKKQGQGLPFSKEYILEKAKASLTPKRDHLIRLFARLGLDIRPLNTKELINLFYRIYNEEIATNEKVQTLNYGAPVVTIKK